MIAYLIGGPQDMVKLHVQDSVSTLSFPHLAATNIQNLFTDPSPPGLMDVKNLRYTKVYENHGPRDRFAIFVLVGDDW